MQICHVAPHLDQAVANRSKQQLSNSVGTELSGEPHADCAKALGSRPLVGINCNGFLEWASWPWQKRGKSNKGEALCDAAVLCRFQHLRGASTGVAVCCTPSEVPCTSRYFQPKS
jgi:hypothetical protein